VSDTASSGDRLPRWISSSATIIAPASVLSALLFYFGYVSSRSQYQYFGVEVDTIGLSTQDYVMRSPQPLLVPLLVLTLVGAGLLVLHAVIRSRVAAAVTGAAAGDDAPDRKRRSTNRIADIRRAARISMVAGSAVLGAGVVLLFTHALVRDWAAYDLVTPLLFTFGGGSIAYASHINHLLPNRRRETPQSDGSRLARRAATVLIYVVIATSIFWAAATVAQWSGRGQAQAAASHLDRLPRIILDTKERLFLRDPGVEETLLPASEGQTFHYRYRRLRLLIVGHDRMFLVPDTWSASNSTLIVPLDGSVRVQFQFQNQRP
jgi:hypothetical protein